VDPRSVLHDMKNLQFFVLPGLELRPLAIPTALPLIYFLGIKCLIVSEEHTCL
jgi:hypothetical protein